MDCAGHYGIDLVVSEFFNVRILRKSHTEFSPPIGPYIYIYIYIYIYPLQSSSAVMSYDSSCDFLISTCVWWLLDYYKGSKQILVL